MLTFSVVTISFNQAQFLERAIRSVVEQEGVDVNYVVVDPGSTDGSRDIIERYRARVDRIILEPDSGAADGLNKGLAACTGDLFAFVNADDELLPGALAEAAALFKRYPDVDVLCGASWQIDEHNRRSRRLISSAHITPKSCARGITLVVQQSTFMRLRAARAVGGFDPDNRTCWDGELFYRMARAGARFRRVDRDWGLFRIYSESISGSGRFQDRYLVESRQMFEREFGRSRGRSDALVAYFGRIAQLLTDPIGLQWKIRNRFGRVQ